MIRVRKSPTADTRTCDVKSVEKGVLLHSSLQHISDVGKGLSFFQGKLTEAAASHDYDKISEIDWFFSDFKTGFESTGWWDNHRLIHRHHLAQADGVPEDVNLIDVIEYITDCTMAGKARSGEVHEISISPEVLARAFKNTCKMLNENVEVVTDA